MLTNSIDIWAAYLTAQRTLIPTDVWIAPDYEVADSAPIQDKCANKAIWIFARIMNRLSEIDPLGKGNSTLHETVTSELVKLWDELDLWYLNRPGQVQSLLEVEASKGEAFPFILFGTSSASKIKTIQEGGLSSWLTKYSLRQHILPYRVPFVT